MRILSMTAVMLFGLFNVSHAVASDCSPAPVEVTSQMSGTLSSLASLRGMVQSSYNRLERKWRVAATGKYGPAYKHMARGTCTCAIQNKEFVAGERESHSPASYQRKLAIMLMYI